MSICACAALILTGQQVWTIITVILPASVFCVTSVFATKSDHYDTIKNEKRLVNAVSVGISTNQEELLNLCHQQKDYIRNENKQVQLILNDAILKLNTSFNGLNTATKEQDEVLLSLVERMTSGNYSDKDDSQSLRDFANEMRKILDYFTEQVLLTSQESITMVEKIDDMAMQMSEVEALVGDVRTIADQTNLLALNAAIEAARAGDAGRGFAVVADEVRKLSQNSNDFSEQISAVVNKALTNIDDAKIIVGQMASKDMTIATSSKLRVDNMLEEIDSMNEFVSVKLGEASTITTSIAEHVNMAIMSLQFEDLARQNIGYIDDQLQNFEEIMDTLSANSAVIESRGTVNLEDIDTALLKMQAMTRDLTLKIEESKCKVVEQVNLDEGDVQYF